jgi:flagellar biosynthesis/type III secretory pathway protein FliH
VAGLTRARIIPQAAGERLPVTRAPQPAAFRRIAREELEAREHAARILTEARAAAETILRDARARATSAIELATREAAAVEQAKLAGQLLALRNREAHADEAALDRSVELARVLAERLVGEALALDPRTVAKLARQALLEARGARTVAIEAHPDDVDALRAHLGTLTAHVASVTADATIDRGSLRLRTDLGTIDANIRPQLERLAAALRDALR